MDINSEEKRDKNLNLNEFDIDLEKIYLLEEKINKIKLKFNTNYKNRTDRKSSSKKKEKKCDTMEEQLIKKIKNNLKVSNNQRKNKSTRNNYNKKERKRNTQYGQIDSHKIMITNININLYKKLTWT